MARKRRSRRYTAGISLIEILIVVAIIALISSGIAVAASKYFSKARIEVANTDARSLRMAVRAWQMLSAASECPTFQELMENGQLERGTRREDPWGQPYKLTCAEGEVVVSSSGSDKRFGTADDIQVPGS